MVIALKKSTYYPPPITFINKRIKGLYIPFVKWSLLFLLFHNIFYYVNIYNNEYGFRGTVSRLYDWKEYFERILRIVIGLHGQEQLLGGYWFLPQLLYASIIGFFVIKYIKNIYMGCFIILLFVFLTSAFDVRVPFWGVRSLTFFSTTFFLIGFLYKKYFDNLNRSYLTILFAIIVAVGSIFFYSTMLSFTIKEIFPYMICAICGTIMTLNISIHISSRSNIVKKLLVYIGDNTLTILTWHFLCFKIISLCIIFLYGLSIEELAYFPIIPKYDSWWFGYFVAGVGIPLVFKRLSNYFIFIRCFLSKKRSK